jgi:hypothetical protein
VRDVVRVARRRRIKVRELGRVGLAKDDGAGEPQGSDDLGIGGGRRAIGTRLAVGQGRDAGDIDDVLDADGNAMQRSAEASPFGLAVQ